MASTHARKRQKQHGETRNVRSSKQSTRKSILGEIDKTKEYSIYWFWENTTSQHDWYKTSKDKLRGIVDYLQKISDINAIRKLDDQNIFLIMNTASFTMHSAQLSTSSQIRSIYVYETYNDNENLTDKDKLLDKKPKVSGY